MTMHTKYAVTIFMLLGLLFVQGAGEDVVASNDDESFQLVVSAVRSTTDTSVQAALL